MASVTGGYESFIPPETSRLVGSPQDRPRFPGQPCSFVRTSEYPKLL